MLKAALTGECPRCGGRTLYAGLADYAAHCRGCGLDFASFAVSDRLGAVLMMLAAVALAALAIRLDAHFRPSFWWHLIVWPPMTAAVVIGAIRLGRGLLLRRAYFRAARDGRLAQEDR